MATSEAWSINYDIQGTASGVIAFDTLGIAGFTIETMQFGAAASVDTRINNDVTQKSSLMILAMGWNYGIRFCGSK
jgi:hypothetical protein